MVDRDGVKRIRDVGLSGRTVLVVVGLVAIAATGGVVAAGAGDTQASVSTVQEENETELTSFVAESQGGYVAFSEDDSEAARTEGTPFPALSEGEEPIQIQAEVDGNTWESTDLTFPRLTVSEDLNLQADVAVIDGLEGEIDPEEGVMTAEGEFRVTIVVDGGNDPTFTYESVQTTEMSGELTGSANFDGDQAEVTLVDNEFTVDEETEQSQLVNNFLELPADEPGENWIELQLEINLDQQELEDRSSDDDDEATAEDGDESTQTAVLTVLGQALGFVGLAAAVLTMVLTLVARFTDLISLEA